ncbi:multidrug effflux MFS transporter [Arcticibacter tournemirensis]|uniref:Bcr/CflA family efflux MFS transporter n=1 Tax=Arcticibacter tournemirensis TaxID=699437 RepID=A0A4Q0M3E5_9SPHI|nr:multidrug effflux MFS transporter [Arcticibacter tournemirensis]RXF67189.1 Bcr/CflA family efflux MFS transporter [Arcticibacter tournemirensis]
MVRNQTAVIITLGALTAIGSLSIDMYLPGFPSIADDLETDVSHVALSLTSFFVGISAGQLFFGPIIERFGRKIPLLTGLSLYLLASFGCTLTNSVNALIILRFFQALGGCSGMVISRTMVRDLFPVSETAKIFSLLMLIMGIAPIIAPTLGGFLAENTGWRSIFILLTAIGGMLLLATARFLPESKAADKTVALYPAAVINRFYVVLKQPMFLTYAIVSGFASAGMFAYISGSPFVFMKLFGLSETEYGWLFGLNATGLIAASQLNRVFLKKRTSRDIVVVAASLQVLSGILLFAGTVTGLITSITTFVLIFIYLMMQGFVFPNSTALSLEPFEQNAGIASALAGSMQMVIAALASAAVSYLHNGTAVPMAMVIAVCTAISFIILITGRIVISRKFIHSNA